MSKKDFNKGMEAGAKPFEEKFENLSKETNKIGEKLNEKLDSLGDVMDIVLDDLSDIQKKELYNLNTPYDLKEDLDDDEKEILSALLIKLSENTKNNEYQRKFIRSVNNYIGITTPQTGLDISCIENIENINSQKIILQAVMEYMYLESCNFDFLNVYEEIFEHFSVNRKGIREIKEHIEAIYRATGEEGIAEKYGFVPEETREEIIDEETLKLYKEATPYDLLVDLSENENKILCNLLDMMVEKEGKNEYQRALLNILEEEGELGLDNISENDINFDDIQNLEVQKIMLQVLMEYGFLGSNEFVFIEDEIFDDFSVNKREIRQIKERIEKVYNEKGYEGIIEKYQYMGKGNEIGKNIEEKGNTDIISQVCADIVNTHKYVELNEYLVYIEEDNNNYTYYKVHKKTGEKIKIRESNQKIFCGTGNKIYIFEIDEDGIGYTDTNNEILEINIDTNEVKKIEIILIREGNYDGYDLVQEERIKPQCNKEYLVYGSVIREEKVIVSVDLKTYKSKVLSDNKGVMISVDSFVLNENNLYYISDILPYKSGMRSPYYLYCYNLKENVSNILIELENLDWPTSYDLYLYKQLFIMAKIGWEEGLVKIIDLDNNKIEEKKFDLKEYDVSRISKILGKDIFFIKEDKEDELLAYDILTGEVRTLLNNSKGIRRYVDGIIFKETRYLNSIDRIQVINDEVYYSTRDNIVYKTPLNQCKDRPERL